MRNFESAEALRAASLKDLERIPEMNARAAESVYNFLHKPKANAGDSAVSENPGVSGKPDVPDNPDVSDNPDVPENPGVL